jgi:DNA polymerase III delta prime subunit
MTTTENLLDGYSIHELAACLFGSAHRIMLDEDSETYSARRALETARRTVYKADQRIDLALDEAQRLVAKMGGLSSLEVILAGEAIMTDRARRLR